MEDLYRNSSEEIFLKYFMESSNGVPAPSMEMLGFKNLSQSFRHADSEELFKCWLTNGENNANNSSSITHRTRQASRRISTELASISSQQHVGILQKKRSNDNLHPQSNSMADNISGDLHQQSISFIRNSVEKGLQNTDLYLAKAWFHSSQPMTRSRSSELRKRYAAMQSAQTTMGMEVMQNASGHSINTLKQEFSNSNCFNDFSTCEIPNQVGRFMSPSNSSSSTFTTPRMADIDKVSSVVSMLKGTLERKKLSNQIEKEAVMDSSLGIYHGHDIVVNSSFDQGQNNHLNEIPRTFQEASHVQVKDSGILLAVEESIDLDMEGFVNPTNQMQLSRASQEPSQSESSAAAPVVSSGLDACDGPSNSSQTLSICESSRKQVGNSRSSENGTKAKEIRERIIDTLKEDRKRGSLVRYGSVTSAGSVDKGDSTKKRRVERSRKMAEAKERNLTPAIPSDVQSVLKRCENLEKEVRSLKLNLSFMNRWTGFLWMRQMYGQSLCVCISWKIKAWGEHVSWLIPLILSVVF
ncbi:protein CYCLOPS-like isoform X1 [Juglans microcarpa x Juglans regia]|uniref:protein CYCLOPS-like isoform X1 n=1 Tax=Juglans microcarpa x Juglans regia TaxID=2249226 RepID=UPI001B7DE7AF|nr:protein CYCLOPS-like isoform X1 [Juglans microcarpa x Juglans regia]XP_040990665.1 protein CYCLOPS-like isoform X1 [Juglans microcarpa x Juglans regia]XP_040990666.1 protein CYCLOPS-like isoform X1 [Juglans microcarpa x Juglans regia]XP_040990667.1 protein CYCLOPS-like isoform X1 [Juglans microcarpa x Juglans regia]